MVVLHSVLKRLIKMAQLIFIEFIVRKKYNCLPLPVCRSLQACGKLINDCCGGELYLVRHIIVYICVVEICCQCSACGMFFSLW